MLGESGNNPWFRVKCAHCGKVHAGVSESETWLSARACANSHQIKSYEYAPELKPQPPVERGDLGDTDG